MPLAERFTLSTSSVCRSIDMFLWITPSPPSWASAIAIALSVTVSIGELRIGMFIEMRCGEPRADLDFGGHDGAEPRLDEHVVEGQPGAGELVGQMVGDLLDVSQVHGRSSAKNPIFSPNRRQIGKVPLTPRLWENFVANGLWGGYIGDTGDLDSSRAFSSCIQCHDEVVA